MKDPVRQLDGLERVKVVVGLGNPGVQYTGARHNVGFAVLDKIAERVGLTWQKSGNAEWAQLSSEMNLLKSLHNRKDVGQDGMEGGLALALCKPLTFMNNSGDIAGILKKQGILPEETLILHDELEKPLGYVGIKFGGSARGHNGLRSFIERWGANFWRLRIGIGRPNDSVNIGDYVIGKFTQDERPAIDMAILKAAQMVARI